MYLYLFQQLGNCNGEREKENNIPVVIVTVCTAHPWVRVGDNTLWDRTGKLMMYLHVALYEEITSIESNCA